MQIKVFCQIRGGVRDDIMSKFPIPLFLCIHDAINQIVLTGMASLVNYVHVGVLYLVPVKMSIVRYFLAVVTGGAYDFPLLVKMKRILHNLLNLFQHTHE